MKKLFLSIVIFSLFSHANAQQGHEIKINLKNCKDTLVYLTYYQFDKNLLVDTVKPIKNGSIVFKGKNKLDKGIYSILGQNKSIYFDFFIDDQSQKIEINSDAATQFTSTLNSPNSKQENDFFDYIRFINSQKKNFDSVLITTKGMSKTDSTALVTAKQKLLSENIANYEKTFLEQTKGSYIGDVLNLKIEKTLKDVPKASNGRPDSIAVFNYYKKHYWDNVNFQDDGMVRTPFFANKMKRYFDALVVKNPDSVAVEIDRIMNKTVQSSIMYKLLLAHFTSTYETSKIMSFDKVFVYIVDHYFKTGKGNDLYNDDNIVKNIINRAEILRPLLLGQIAPDLPMITIEGHDKIAKMGFDTAKTSEEVTKLYYANSQEIEKTVLRLHSIKADYLVLVFWDVDCGHCKVEIPKLLETYHALLKEKKDIKVFCVYTQQEFEKYRDYVAENKLDWINVYDGVHFTNLKDKYDIYSTPVIYILDKNKKIKAKRIGEEQVKEIINAMELEYKAGVK
ncbi:TlpA family protein disulfide reductase [Flavobacterium psychrotolerans]|nr:TlpA family protein disulfide reductase [Flavobacterium psychrotolerans]